ncbi:uncharacterized protein LOC129225657 isoform X2 [Uloborus diversus]|nr:uncharacterized protein LOC129225657 isoform X2 [Uloborus diversus]XP_054716108.1 uncharacterized protein LOC129225657 isoform X2 [Uloborus diversus]
MSSEKTNSSKNESETTSSGPTVMFLWVWNWFATLPKTVTNLYADLKSGELLARFTLLDAMMQFIVAVATSCHPQGTSDEGYEYEEHTPNGDTSSPNKSKDIKVFGGTGRTLRSRTIEASS